MKELLYEGKEPLVHLPHGEKMWAIALPCSMELNKDGLPKLSNPETREILRYFKLERDLGVNMAKYGKHVFYLGTFQNPAGGKFRIYSFPVKWKEREEYDLTMISQSAEDLNIMCKRQGVSICLLPVITFGFDYAVFNTCYKPVMDLILGDEFVVIHRGGKNVE